MDDVEEPRILKFVCFVYFFTDKVANKDDYIFDDNVYINSIYICFYMPSDGM